MHIIKLSGTDNYNLGDDLLYISAYDILTRTEIPFQVKIDSSRVRNLVKQFFHIDNENLFNNDSHSHSINVGGTLFSSKYLLKTRVGHSLGIKKIPFDDSSDIYISLGLDDNYFLKKLSRRVFEQAKCVIVRDVESHVIISKEINFYKSHILPDTVLCLKSRLAMILGNVEEVDFNIFILRDWKFSRAKMREQTEWFIKNKTENDLVILFSKNDEVEITFKNKVIRYSGDYESMIEIVKVLNRAKKIYTSRYHGIVMAIALDKEFEVFPIDEKLSRINDYYRSDSKDHEIYVKLTDGEAIANSYSKIIQEYL